MSSCHETNEPKTSASTCAAAAPTQSSCCPSNVSKKKFDWLLWGSLFLSSSFYILGLFLEQHETWFAIAAHSVIELINIMWWSLLLAILFIGLLSKIPQNFVISILGQGGSFKGLVRATLAGTLLDLCSHGILMVAMELYRKGASLGQVMAFLIASPWNSISLTLIMIALIGLPWTLAFIGLSIIIGISTGWLFDRLEQRDSFPTKRSIHKLPSDFKFWPEAKKELKGVSWNKTFFLSTLSDGLTGSRMVVRWILFGVLLASAVRAFMPLDLFQSYFGPTMLGLAATLIAATLIEVCSEGSTPIAADLMTRANAPGNSFTFLMGGVATDYTEIMVIRDTMKSWKVALFLPLLTIPQVIIVAMFLNNSFG